MKTGPVKTMVRKLYAHNRKGEPTKLKLGGKAKPKGARLMPGATIRCNDLERFFRDRYGAVLPDDDAGREDAEIMLNHIAYRQAADRQWLMNEWLDRWTPWMPADERAAMISRVFRHPIRYTADVLAAKIGLRYARRQRLGITMIGAVDVTAEQREEIRAAKARARKAAARRAAGKMTREEYEGESLAKTAPWEALGISKRTYYRRLKSGKSHYAADGLVPPIAYARMTVRCA